MNNVLTIARRELRASFDLPIAYVTIAAFLALSAVGGLLGFFDRGVADLRDYFLGLRYAFVLFAPAIAMRLWAEERRQGTFELLFTLPVAPWEAVLGKFLGALGLVAVALALGAALPLSLARVASFDVGAVFAGYLGALLLAALELAIGLLVSALTENQIVAFVGGAAASFFLLIAGEPVVLHEAEQLHLPDVVTGALARLGTGSHESLARGVLETRDLVYFLGFTALFLFANVVAVERRRPRGRYEAVLAVALAVLAAVIGQDLATRRSARLDLTSRRQFTLGEGTRRALEGLEATLTIRCYLSSDLPAEEERHRRALLDLLEDVEAAGRGNVRLEVLDPGRDDRLAAQAEREGITKITRQESRGERVEARLIYCGLTLLYAGKPPVAIPFALYRQNLEYDLAVDIERLTRAQPRRIAFLEARAGHQGGEPFKRARDELARSYTVEDLDLAKKGSVPADYQTVVVVADPVERGALDARQLYALDQFVLRGGSLVVLAQAVDVDGRAWKVKPAASSPLFTQLASYGIRVSPSAVLAPAARAYPLNSPAARGIVVARYPFFLVVDGRSSEGSPVAGQVADAMLPFATEVSLDEGHLAPGVSGTTLARSYPGWKLGGEAEVVVDPGRPLDTASLGPQEPHPLAAAVTGALPSAFTGKPVPPPPASVREDPLAKPLAQGHDGKVLVFGNTEFARDYWVERFPQNLTLFLNAVDWASQDALLVALRGRAIPPALDAKKDLEDAKALAWGINLFGLPLLVIVRGLARFLLRRRAGRRAAARSRGA